MLSAEEKDEMRRRYDTELTRKNIEEEKRRKEEEEHNLWYHYDWRDKRYAIRKELFKKEIIRYKLSFLIDLIGILSIVLCFYYSWWFYTLCILSVFISNLLCSVNTHNIEQIRWGTTGDQILELMLVCIFAPLAILLRFLLVPFSDPIGEARIDTSYEGPRERRIGRIDKDRNIYMEN
jgi:hypothetical protein